MSVDEPMPALLNSYPRKRPPLPPAHQAIYVKHLRDNRLGSRPLQSLVLRLESWMHRQIAARQPPSRNSILEIGAGTLNHVPYESHGESYDVVEPFRELYEDSPWRNRVSAIYAGIREVPGENRYDRILSVATLEHLTDLPEVVARSALLLTPGGIFQAGIPTEGGFLWGAAWRCTTALSFRLHTGLDYKSMMQHEHVNNASEILTVLGCFFASVQVRRFPLPLLHLSLYTYMEAAHPRTRACATFLGEAANDLK